MPRNWSVSTVPQAYLFAIGTLLFGLPLLTAYYNVNSSFYFDVLGPYLIVSLLVTFAILIRPTGKGEPRVAEPRESGLAAKFNSIPSSAILGLFTLTVVVFGAVRYLIFTSYPYPPPPAASVLGSTYIGLLTVTSILGFSRILYVGFPGLAKLLRIRWYALMAGILSLSFALVYLALVNQILVAGYNVLQNMQSPSNTYPFAYTFTVGIEQPLLNMVYLPYSVVQLNPQVNLLIIPFEMVFATLLGFLVASNVSMAHFLISRSGLRCSTPAATTSAFGSVIGLTATCPTCLAPTLVSVLFGGLTSAEAVYSNVYGAIIPPIASVATLTLSLVYLSREIKKRGLDPLAELSSGTKTI